MLWGIDLGGTNVRASVVDNNGSIIGEARTDSRAMDGLEFTIGRIIMAVKEAVEKSPVQMSNILAMGMGVPGTHKSAEGVVIWSPNFKGWDNVQLLAPIKAELGIPIFYG